ncbi:MAG: hypothetical protein GY838_17305 [bacterium]|nr:hypothetical protein [bacterium]
MMAATRTRRFLITGPYWLGIAADGLWAVAFFVPAVFGALTGDREVVPSLALDLVLGVAGVLMTAWTILLLWAVREPIGRRFVILLTAAVVAGLFVVTLVGSRQGNGPGTWILVKCGVLFAAMITSYVLAGRADAD